MLNLLKHLFSGEPFMPHIHCFLGDPGLTWLHVLSDGAIGISYVVISLTLGYLVYRGRREIPFHSMFLAFGVFIIACGGTHFMEIWTLWVPAYWLSGGVKAITAAASVLTAIALPPLVPVAVKMVRDANLSERRQRELEAKNEELAQLYDRLKEFDDLKTQFFANVSHELRTPLTLILGPTDRLLREPAAEAFSQELAGIQRNARLLQKHVNDLLDVARMESGAMPIHYRRTDLARLVNLAASHFETVARDRAVRMELALPASLDAEVDPDKVQRILINLLGNAFKFTDAGGVVRCSLRQEEDVAVLEVADSGIGVPEEMRDKIFERFRQVDGGATRQHSGTGLGLAIVKEFVELQHGSISVDRAPEGGALFVVKLPLAAPPGTDVLSGEPQTNGLEHLSEWKLERSEDAGTREEPALVADDRRPLALVVEDNAELNQFIVESLTPQFRTATARNGQEGFEIAARVHPDVIITDVMMPGMSGDQMLELLRDTPALEDVPVVVLTARSDETLRNTLLRKGAQDYLMKPFSPEELRARASNLAQMKRVRDVLQSDLSARLRDLEGLAREVTTQRRDLEIAVESMRIARDQAERATSVKANFLRLVSHELRTPLTALTLQLQLLQRHRASSLSDREQESLRKMRVAADRLQDLIETLLEHARIEAGQMSVAPSTFDLGRLAGETIDEAIAHAEQRGLELFVVPPGDLPPLRSDRRLVRLIVTNLIDNALKFTDQGKVEVSLGYSGEQHEIRVTDTGSGISIEDLSRIFEPFEHLEPLTRKHTPGVGLGLALVREMVEALGGRITVESTVGSGSTFRVFLPSLPEPEPPVRRG